MEQKQQYPTINCKKVSKAKTTSLKLYENDESSSDSVQKKDRFDLNTSIKQQGVKSLPKSQNFSYLEQSRNGLGKGKSFQDIMEESRKILQMRKHIEDEQKKKEESKKSKKAKKTQKKRKQTNSNKKKPILDKQKDEEKEIYLSEIDIQKFSTQSGQIKRLIEKMDWLRNLGQKCNIISPFLLQIQKHSQQNNEDQDQGQMSRKKQLFIDKNDDMLIKVSQLELEIQLMKRNLDQNLQEKDFLNPFQLSQLAKLQIQQKSAQGAFKLKNSYPFLEKYLDKENLQQYAEDLQNQLEHMEKTEFHRFNDQVNDQKLV